MCKRKYKTDLKKHMMQAAITTLIFSCIISSLIVSIGVKVFYHGEMTHETLGVVGIIFCILVIIMDGFLFSQGCKALIKPMIEANDVVTEVAKGNFKMQIKRKEMTNPNYEYFNEIDELSKNVNIMVNELDGMTYMRKDFMRNVSHEVKTPIAAITGFTEILLEGEISEKEQKEYLEIIHNESLRVSRLCQNMLSMATLDNQTMVTSTKVFELDEQIRKCVILLLEKWSDRDIDFAIDLEPISIESDPDMLGQVWINLIDNAIKYSGENCKISISAKEVEDGKVLVEISDNGIGIETGKQDKIFDAFYQCEESHKSKGNGLGLSIVKRILELLNGTIVCESKEGLGTTMKVTIEKNRNA